MYSPPKEPSTMSSNKLDSKEGIHLETAINMLNGFRIALETKLKLGANSVCIEDIKYRIENEQMTWEIFYEALADLERRVRYQVRVAIIKGTFVPIRVMEKPKPSKSSLLGGLVDQIKIRIRNWTTGDRNLKGRKSLAAA